MDFDPFLTEIDAQIRVIEKGIDLGEPDAIILPGSRNVKADLLFLEKNGLLQPLKAYAERIIKYDKGYLIGICGGLQLLGATFEDPQNAESGEKFPCLNLLPLATVLNKNKILRRQTGKIIFANNEYPIHGYEIHHGETFAIGKITICAKDSRDGDLGYAHSAKPDKIWGTYLHGIFDGDSFRHAFLEKIRKEKGLPQKNRTQYDPDAALDQLAEQLERSLNIDKILADGR